MALPESYFNDDRLRAYLRVLNEENTFKSFFEVVYAFDLEALEQAKLMDSLDVFVDGGFYRVPIKQREYYERLNKPNGKFEFEEYMLGIKFQFPPEDYDKINKYQDGLIYFFSNIEKKEDRDTVEIIVKKQKMIFNRRDVSRYFMIDSDLDYLRQLDSMGTLMIPELEAKRESINCGQMKIATDLIMLAQMVDSTSSVKVLVVGSAAEGYGGGRSYGLLDTMFSNSEFHLYDPNEVNHSYLTQRGNKYVHKSQRFDYKSVDIKVFDLIQDDAYVTHERNRERLDEGRFLLNHKNFSCKSLNKDKVYFSSVGYTMKQVGLTPSREKRCYSKVILRTKDPDLRFKSCQFCLELRKYVPRGKYGDDFFEAWGKIHPSHMYCYEQKNAMIVGGCKTTSIGDVYLECSVPESLCFSYDIVPGCQVVNSMVKDLWYQFSTLDRIPPEMRDGGKFAVYDPQIDCYYCSHDMQVPVPQIDSGQIELFGFFFSRSSEKYDEFDCYKNYRLRPIVNPDILRNSILYYEAVFMRCNGTLFKSRPRMSFR